jgi:hypothetical protein
MAGSRYIYKHRAETQLSCCCKNIDKLVSIYIKHQRLCWLYTHWLLVSHWQPLNFSLNRRKITTRSVRCRKTSANCKVRARISMVSVGKRRNAINFSRRVHAERERERALQHTHTRKYQFNLRYRRATRQWAEWIYHLQLGAKKFVFV